MKFKRLLFLICCLILIIPAIASAHSVSYSKRLYYNESSDLYSTMNIYLSSVDSWWWNVSHAHQTFTFGYSTVKSSQLEYFKIWDQDDDVIYSRVGSTYTSDYDNAYTPNVKIYKGDNYLKMRVKNEDITNQNGYIETYYWYESVYWDNV